MQKFKQISNLYKSDRSSESTGKRTKINAINPKPQPRKPSSTVIGWTPELKETVCQYASVPGHRHVSAVLPKKTVVRKFSKAMDRRESKVASMSVYRQSEEPRIMESQYPVVYRTEITPRENIYNNKIRKSQLENPQKRWSTLVSQKKFQELSKLSEERNNNAAGQFLKKRRVSFLEDLKTSRLPSSVPGIDVCGLTIVIRDARKISAPLMNTKSYNSKQI